MHKQVIQAKQGQFGIPQASRIHGIDLKMAKMRLNDTGPMLGPVCTRGVSRVQSVVVHGEREIGSMPNY